ncbi:MAG: threonine synthase, partial [Firmicutes bacterium]|nr:threonine synthase [Bacillota bacterium]
KDQLPEYCQKAYSRFDGDPAPLVKINDGLYVLELWHGPTHAFKDIALTLLPYLFVGSKKVVGDTTQTLILVATSGDTGKAALEGFKDVEGTRVVVLYPEDGVSNLQKLQMQTAEGGNVKVFAIKGNFDDAQTAVKEIFTDKANAADLIKSGIALSSANSINFGRLVPQIVYYFSAYADLLDSDQIKFGDKVNFCVPTGNFGNILAGYYALRMGLPVGKLICASNQNNVLTDFIEEGKYNIKDRPFHKTTSPSMDILISSNLERLIFELSGRDDKLTMQRMQELKSSGKYAIEEKELADMGKIFRAGCADEEEVKETIADMFDEYGYCADPHTAVALSMQEDENNTKQATAYLSTASPYKFVDSVLEALGEKKGATELKSLVKLEVLTALPVPKSLSELPKLKILHKEILEKGEVKKKILDWAKG